MSEMSFLAHLLSKNVYFVTLYLVFNKNSFKRNSAPDHEYAWFIAKICHFLLDFACLVWSNAFIYYVKNYQ